MKNKKLLYLTLMTAPLILSSCMALPDLSIPSLESSAESKPSKQSEQSEAEMSSVRSEPASSAAKSSSQVVTPASSSSKAPASSSNAPASSSQAPASSSTASSSSQPASSSSSKPSESSEATSSMPSSSSSQPASSSDKPGSSNSYDLSSVIESSQEESSEESISIEPSYPVLIPNESNEFSYGLYPQTIVNDSSIKSSLEALAGAFPSAGEEIKGNWKSYGFFADGSVSHYMWYQDVEFSGQKYRGVVFSSYRPYSTTDSAVSECSYQDDNGFSTMIDYWFKWEPIQWTVLSYSTEDGVGEAEVFSKQILDSQQFTRTYFTSRTANGQRVEENNWKHSDISEFANNDFYNAAFADSEKVCIIKSNVDNSVFTTGVATNPYACENTEEKIFLVSARQAQEMMQVSSSLKKSATDYAKCMGVYVNNAPGTENDGYSSWLLRSPDNEYADYAKHVNYRGNINAFNVNRTSLGFVPATRVMLNTNE